MFDSENIETVKALYDAFGRGDVETVLDLMTDDVDWSTETTSTAAPWYGVKRGKEGVASFFETMGKTVEVEEFVPLVYAVSGDGDVLTVIRYRHRSRETGKSASMLLHHWFRVTDGKISSCRGTEDTAATAEILTP